LPAGPIIVWRSHPLPGFTGLERILTFVAAAGVFADSFSGAFPAGAFPFVLRTVLADVCGFTICIGLFGLEKKSDVVPADADVRADLLFGAGAVGAGLFAAFCCEDLLALGAGEPIPLGEPPWIWHRSQSFVGSLDPPIFVDIGLVSKSNNWL
jgi:hypothetical protein